MRPALKVLICDFRRRCAEPDGINVRLRNGFTT